MAPAPLDVEAVTPEMVHDRIAQATAEPMRAAAERLGRVVAAEDGVQVALGLLEGESGTASA